jgi:hypothetical protein
MLRRIGRLGRRGRVRIITAAKSDNDATIAAARHSYSRLLRRHVEMYEYQPAKLHTSSRSWTMSSTSARPTSIIAASTSTWR